MLMKKTVKALKIFGSLVAICLLSIACDRDFASIESDIEGSQNFDTDNVLYPIIAYNKKLNPVQTNNLSSNLLGVYKDDVYGITTTSVVSQITPTTFNPIFGEDPILQSVILTIPYYSTNEGTDEEGNTEYSLDSLFGNAPIKLSIYQNNYFLRELNPDNIEETQNYYSNANTTINFDNHLGQLLYETTDTGFTFSSDEIDGEEEDEKLAPGLQVSLSDITEQFWEDLLFFGEEGRIELSNANNFREYFRGLYFKAETLGVSNNGSMIMLDFDNAYIIVNYSKLIDAETNQRDDASFRFNFTGTRVNIIENDPANSVIADADAAANDTEGDQLLYLKGGEGSMAIVELFDGDNFDSNTTTDNAFEAFKKAFAEVDDTTGDFLEPKRLVNEANLVFYVDQNQVTTPSQEPDRVILYDLENNSPLIDYFFDVTTNGADPLNSKVFHSNILERDENDNGIRYKIRITEHINNLILRDSTNVKLGLFVSTNVNEIENSIIFDNENETVKNLPTGTVMAPKGTILYGSNPNVAEEKRVQLEIFYTEPENE